MWFRSFIFLSLQLNACSLAKIAENYYCISFHLAVFSLLLLLLLHLNLPRKKNEEKKRNTKTKNKMIFFAWNEARHHQPNAFLQMKVFFWMQLSNWISRNSSITWSSNNRKCQIRQLDWTEQNTMWMVVHAIVVYILHRVHTCIHMPTRNHRKMRCDAMRCNAM